MSMLSFRHVVSPLTLLCGPDSLAHLGRVLDRLNSRRAVIFCGATLGSAAGRDGAALELVRAAMGDRCAGIFSGVRAHSPVPAVEAGVHALRQLRADAVVAVGGGSAIVTARAASILLAEAGDIRALATSRDERGGLRSPKLLAPKLPHLVVPTTPTTAMVKAGSAVFDPVSGDRLALFDPKTRAQAVFMHPDLAATTPRGLVITAALDTLSGSLEGLMSRPGDPLADAILMHALRLLARHLPRIPTSDDVAARLELMLAATLCGRGTDHTGAGIATVLGHAIGARHNVENGVAKAIVMPHVLRFNAPAAAAGLGKIAAAFGLEDAGTTDAGGSPLVAAVVTALGAILAPLGLPGRLRDVGVTKEALPGIAERGMGDWFLRGNPRPVNEAAELQQVLAASW